MHIITKDGKIFEGEPLTEAEALVHLELPKILKSCQYAFVSTADSKHLAEHLIKHIEMKLRPVPSAEDIAPVEYPEPSKSLPLVETPEETLGDDPNF